MDPIETRLYLARRLHEARAIEARAGAIVRELDEALSDPGAGLAMNPIRAAKWTVMRRGMLDEWVTRVGLQLDHVEVELLIFAFAPRCRCGR